MERLLGDGSLGDSSGIAVTRRSSVAQGSRGAWRHGHKGRDCPDWEQVIVFFFEYSSGPRCEIRSGEPSKYFGAVAGLWIIVLGI